MEFPVFFRRSKSAAKKASDAAIAAAEVQRAWVLLRPRMRITDGNFCLTMDLTSPHAGEAAAQVRGRALSIQVLRVGSNIALAEPDQCYRRTVPLQEALDPDTIQINLSGDQLEITARVADDNQDSGSTGLRRTAWRQLANSVVVASDHPTARPDSARAIA